MKAESITIQIENTINTGNYENIKILVSQTRETTNPEEEKENLYNELYSFLKKKRKKINKDLKR